MSSIRQMLDSVLAAGSDSDSNASVGTRFGLMFDPLHYLAEPFGFQDNYDAFVNKSGDFLNKQGSSVAQPIDKFARQYDPLHKAITSTQTGDSIARWGVNKPASAAGVIYGGIEGAGALLGGGGQAGGAGGQIPTYGQYGGFQGNSGLGVFANGGQGGMAGVGGGNAGALAASGKIAGGAGAAGLPSQYTDYAAKANGLLDQGGGGGGGMLGSPFQPVSMPMGSSPQGSQSSIDQRQRGMKGFGRRPYSYRGSIVWV